MNNFIRLLLHNGMMNAIAGIFYKISSFLVVIIVANIESEEVVGIYGFIYLTLMTFQTISASGITTSITKRLAEVSENSDIEKYILLSGFLLSFSFSFVIFSLIYTFNDNLSMLISDKDISNLFKVASFYFLFSGFSTFSLGCVYARLNYKKLMPVNIVYGVTLVFSTYYLTKNFSLSGAVIALVLSEFFRALYLMISVRNDLKKIIFSIDSSLTFNFLNYLWGFVKFAYPIGFSGIIVMVANWYAMKLVVQNFGFVENASVVALNNIQSIALYIPLSIGTALLPILSKGLYDSPNSNIKSGIKLLLFGSILISIPLYLFKDTIDYHYGFVINGEAFFAMLLLTTVLSVSNVVENSLVSLGESKLFITSNLIMSITFISILLVFSPSVITFFLAKLIAYVLRLIYLSFKIIPLSKKDHVKYC